jgi:hypothetical protein
MIGWGQDKVRKVGKLDHTAVEPPSLEMSIDRGGVAGQRSPWGGLPLTVKWVTMSHRGKARRVSYMASIRQRAYCVETSSNRVTGLGR